MLVFGHLDVGGRRPDCRPELLSSGGKYRLVHYGPVDIPSLR